MNLLVGRRFIRECPHGMKQCSREQTDDSTCLYVRMYVYVYIYIYIYINVCVFSFLPGQHLGRNERSGQGVDGVDDPFVLLKLLEQAVTLVLCKLLRISKGPLLQCLLVGDGAASGTIHHGSEYRPSTSLVCELPIVDRESDIIDILGPHNVFL